MVGAAFLKRAWQPLIEAAQRVRAMKLRKGASWIGDRWDGRRVMVFDDE
jgi:hypothetical protein